MVRRMRQWLCRWVTTIRVLGVPVMPPVSGTPVEGSGITVREVGCEYPYGSDTEWNDSDECYRNVPVMKTVGLVVPARRNSRGACTLKAREETDSLRIVRS